MKEWSVQQFCGTKTVATFHDIVKISENNKFLLCFSPLVPSMHFLRPLLKKIDCAYGFIYYKVCYDLFTFNVLTV